MEKNRIDEKEIGIDGLHAKTFVNKFANNVCRRETDSGESAKKTTATINRELIGTLD